METKKFNRLLTILTYNQCAMKEIYEEYQPKIVLRINKLYRNYGEEFAKDIAQEFFYQLYTERRHHTYIEYPTAWIYTVSENLVKHKIKKLDLTEISFDNIDYNILDSLDFEEIDKVINNLDLQKALCQLNESEKRIIFYHYWLGYSLKELAVMNQIKYDNMKQKFHRIIKKMKKII